MMDEPPPRSSKVSGGSEAEEIAAVVAGSDDMQLCGLLAVARGDRDPLDTTRHTTTNIKTKRTGDQETRTC